MSDNLATKYRPKTLDGYIGNNKIKSDIRRMMAVNDENLPKSFMFVGTSGCGKTTIARLIAKRYLKNTVDEKTLNDYIETGDFTAIETLREIDVAQDRGIAEMEAIKNDIQTPSFDGSWKVFIFDEFHASSFASQNALLKLLEDTPEKVLMIFCTTNKERVLPTILGRIQHIYTVTKPESAELSTYLVSICKEEGWKYDLQGLQMISKLSGYQIRDAMRNLGEVIDSYDEATTASVSARFDVITDVYAKKFFKAYKKKDVLLGAEVLYTVKTKYDLISFYDLIREYIKRGLYIRYGVMVDGYDKKEMQAYKELFKDFTIDECHGMLQDLQELDKYANNTDSLEVKLLSMLHAGIPSGQPTVMQGQQEEPEETTDAKLKSFVDNKKIEDAIRNAHKTEKVVASEEQSKAELEKLAQPISILENLELFKGKVHRVLGKLPE